MSSRGTANLLILITTSEVTNLTHTWSIMECWAAQDIVTRVLYYFYGYTNISGHLLSLSEPLYGYIPSCYSLLCLSTTADHPDQRIYIFLGIQAQLLEVNAQGYQYLGQGELPLGGLVHHSWAGGVALRPLAGVHQVERAASGRGPVVACCLETPVPALQGPWQRGSFNLETHPVTKRNNKIWKLLKKKTMLSVNEDQDKWFFNFQ